MSVYVLDTCTIRELLFHFDRSIRIFEVMWDKLENMIIENEALFVKETYKELERQLSKNASQMLWLTKYKEFFLSPTNEECKVVKQIYSHRNFQNNIALKNMLEGRPVADAFITAKAKIIGIDAIVVSREKNTQNAAKVPNMCELLNVQCIYDTDFQRMLLS